MKIPFEDGVWVVGDCVETMRGMADGSVDLTITSPPYDDLRTYNGFRVDIDSIADELFRVTSEGGVVVWNVADQTVKGSETGTSFRQALRFMEAGFLLADTMIYQKANPGGARGSNKTYIQCFEYMFVFSRGPLRTYNLLYDRPNKAGGGVRKGGGRRNKDGSKAPTLTYEESEFGRRFNIWEISTTSESRKTNHPAVFPEALARDHILSWSEPGETVFDPFGGSGTTAAMARQEGRRWVSCDLSEEYAQIAVERLLGL